MTVTTVSHARTLNALEATALKLVMRDQPFQEGADITIYLGNEGGVDFVGVKRAGNEVKIHFGPEHDLSNDDAPNAKVKTESALTTPTATKVVPKLPKAGKKVSTRKGRDR